MEYYQIGFDPKQDYETGQVFLQHPIPSSFPSPHFLLLPPAPLTALLDTVVSHSKSCLTLIGCLTNLNILKVNEGELLGYLQAVAF